MNDYEDPKDRWKLLSKELSLKQEVINRVKQDLHEKDTQLKDKGQEVVKMREEVHLLDQENYELTEKLRVEQSIANQTNVEIPKYIMTTPLHDLRTGLLAGAHSYL